MMDPTGSTPAWRPAGDMDRSGSGRTGARPLIVCGMPRSGTRFCADVLNLHPEVCLQGEIPSPAANALFRYVRDLSAHYANSDPVRQSTWLRKRYDLLFLNFGFASQNNILDKGQVLYVGHKTPGHERHFDFYEEVFNDPKRLATYIYCLRSPEEVWRSLLNMPWNPFENVHYFYDRYMRSLQHFERMQKRAPERVHMFDLNAFVMAECKETFVGKTLLSPLALEHKSVLSRLSEAGRNDSVTAVGRKPAELSEGDRETLASLAPLIDGVRNGVRERARLTQGR